MNRYRTCVHAFGEWSEWLDAAPHPEGKTRQKRSRQCAKCNRYETEVQEV